MTMPPGTKYKYDPVLQIEKRKSKLSRLSSHDVGGMISHILDSSIEHLCLLSCPVLILDLNFVFALSPSRYQSR